MDRLYRLFCYTVCDSFKQKGEIEAGFNGDSMQRYYHRILVGASSAAGPGLEPGSSHFAAEYIRRVDYGGLFRIDGDCGKPLSEVLSGNYRDPQSGFICLKRKDVFIEVSNH